jgi:hypothetical protein
MKSIFLISLFLITQASFSSSTYKSKTYRPSNSSSSNSGFIKVSAPKSSDNNYKPVIQEPTPLKERELKQHLLKMSRDGVTVNDIKVIQEKFKVKGTYKTDFLLNKFLEKLKDPEEIKRELKVKKWKTRFAGKNTYHYEISGVNLW